MKINHLLFIMVLCFILPMSKALAAPVMTSPAPGSTLTQSSQTFNWSANGTAGITEWYVYLGTTGVGSYNKYYGSQGTNTSVTLQTPNTGVTLYFRLWYKTNRWQFVDYTYTACTGCAAPPPTVVTMVSPTNGSTLTQTSQLFSWQLSSGSATTYWLYVGTSGAGSRNILNASQGSSTQTIVNNLPSNGSTIYVRLWYLSGNWQFIDYTYTSCTGCTNQPKIVLKKTSQVISDGVNSTNPKRIPGAIIEYTITASNIGYGKADNNSIVIHDRIANKLDIDPNSIQFKDGSPSSGLSMGNLSFYSAGSGANATHIDSITIGTQGQFAATTNAGSPSFQIKFRAKLK
jgi:hypothetical protein